MENQFRIKKITLCSQKTELAVETTGTNLNVLILKYKLCSWSVLSLNERKGSSEEICPIG